MKYELYITPSARKQLKKLPETIQASVNTKLDLLADSPFNEALDIKKLKGYDDAYRLRIGKYRLIYELYQKRLIISVVAIAHRKEIY